MLIWIALVLAGTPAPAAGAPTAAPPPATWTVAADAYDDLVAEYEAALAAYETAVEERERGDARPRHPAREFDERFAALADAGDDRAALWQLANLRRLEASSSKRSDRSVALLERLTAEGVPDALLGDALAAALDRPRDLDAAAVRAAADRVAAQARPAAVAAAARALLGARLVADEETEVEGEAVLRAVVDEHAGTPAALAAGAILCTRLEAALKLEVGAFVKAQQEREAAGEQPDWSGLPGPEFAPRFLALAELGVPKARLWVFGNAQHFGGSTPGSPNETALDMGRRIVTENADDPVAEQFASNLSWASWTVGEDVARDLAQQLADNTHDRDTRAQALYTVVTLTAGGDATEAQADEALALIAALREEFGDHPIAARLDSKEFQLTRLRVGQVAPDFEGLDADGEAIALSDYRGKVVLLDFWGYW